MLAWSTQWCRSRKPWRKQHHMAVSTLPGSGHSYKLHMSCRNTRVSQSEHPQRAGKSTCRDSGQKPCIAGFNSPRIGRIQDRQITECTQTQNQALHSPRIGRIQDRQISAWAQNALRLRIRHLNSRLHLSWARDLIRPFGRRRNRRMMIPWLGLQFDNLIGGNLSGSLLPASHTPFSEWGDSVQIQNQSHSPWYQGEKKIIKTFAPSQMQMI